ncbi:hypothetical protein [Pseudobutyrivibrio sp.]
MIFCAVILDDGLVSDMKAFTTKDKALKYLNNYIALSICDSYMNDEINIEKTQMYYRFEYGAHYSEVMIYQVEED